MDPASPYAPTSGEGSEISEVAEPTAAGPAGSMTSPAAELLREVDVLVQRHHRELVHCLEEWCVQVQQSQQYSSASAWSEGPAGRAARQMPVQGEIEDCLPYGIISSTDPMAWKAMLPNHLPDKMAAKVAVKKKPKKKKPTAKQHNVLPITRMPTRLNILQRITGSRRYEAVSGVLICLNAIFIGVQTQFMANRAEDDAVNNMPVRVHTPSVFMALQIFFCLVFSIELGLRWACEGLLEFFRDVDVWWNVLDVAVVVLSIIDLLVSGIVENGLTNEVLGNISALRVIRVIRVVRIARVIRIMRFFRELRMMIFSILGSLKSLMWVILVLVMTFYLFGVTFTAATTAQLSTLERMLAPETEALRRNFGSLDRSILTLFMAMSGGNDWGMYYDALDPLPGAYRGVFLVFISFSVFAVVNIVTGVFVETAMQCSQLDREVMVQEELDAKKTYLTSMRDLFEEMDEDDTGCISMAEFEKKLNDERVIAYFNALKLDVSDARTVFRLLDYDQSEEVNIDEFLSGCYRLQGESRSLDMKIMQCEVRFLHESFVHFSNMLRELHVSMKDGTATATTMRPRRFSAPTSS